MTQNTKPPTLTAEECKRMDHAMLEDKRNDGYSKRACASALLQQVRWQNTAGK